jgi:phage shock protein PspC (stress-responsive transcriptional regulator)
MDLQSKKLYRSRTNRMIGGVCAGIGEYLNLDPTVIRLLFVLLGFATAGTAIVAYIIMLLVVPEEPGFSAPGAARPVEPPIEVTPPSEPPIPPAAD